MVKVTRGLPVSLMLIVCILSIAITRSFGATEPPSFGPLPDGLGVNIHFTHARPGELEMLAAAGFKWVRMDLSWGGIERTKGEYDFSAYEHLLSELDNFGIRAVLILDYGNALYDDGLSPHTDEGRAAFAKWAAATAHHFKGRGVLWEMWNEPNGGFWKPKADVDEYAKLALVVGKAIREAEPGEIYIGPATSGVDLKFMEACFRAGCLDYWSAVSCHPYRQNDPETAAADYQKLRLLIARYAPAGKNIPIISGEWGYSVGWHNFDDDRQGKYLPRQWLTNQWQQVPLSIWYDWHDDGTDPKEPEHHFGTVRNGYRQRSNDVYEPKPAYLAARTLTTQLAGYRFNKRLAMESSDDFVLLFDKGADVRVVAWTTAKQPHEIIIPASAGDFAATSHVGVSLPNVHAGEKGLAVTVGDAPLYLAPKARNEKLELAAAISRLVLETFIHAPAEVDIPLSAQRGGEVHQHVKATRSAAIQTLKLGWNIATGTMVSQQTSVVVLNPLIAKVMPLRWPVVAVRVEDPSREGFKGAVRIKSVIHGQRQETDLGIEIPPGKGEAEIRVRLGGAPDEGEVEGSLLDDKRQDILTLPPEKFDALPDFAVGTGNGKTSACELQADGNSKVASEQSLTVESPSESAPDPGMGVLKIVYAKPRPGWKFWQVVPKTQELRKIDGKPKAFGIWVEGDATGASQRIRFTDSTGQTFQPGAENITWTGWRYVEFDLAADSPSGSHWGGAKDGIIHYPIHWDALYLVDRDSNHPAAGTVRISGPTLIR